MSHSKEADRGENYNFRWGKKRGVYGKNFQTYESFTFDGMEYSLYDCVYLHTEDEPEPYIGKIIKIWEKPNHRRRIKVVWFFRPIELVNWFEDVPLKNEIFLACGEGIGVSNVNPLEVIVGKCNVICTSKDTRNPQPSDDELRMADYIFYRTFNVGNYTISERIEDSIAGIEGMYFFNRKVRQSPSGVPKHTNLKDDEGKINSSSETSHLLSNLRKSQETLVKDKKLGCPTSSVSKGGRVEPFSDEQTKSRRSISFDEDEAKSGKVNESRVGNEENPKSAESKPGSVLFGNMPSEKVHPVGNAQSLKSAESSPGSVLFGNMPSKKWKINDSLAKSSEELALRKGKTAICLQRVSETHVRDPEDKTKAMIVKDSIRQDQSFKKVKTDEKVVKPSEGTLHKGAPALAVKGIVTDAQRSLVTRRSDVDRSKWFRNLDIIRQGFREECYSKVIPRTAFSSPHSGKAIVIFKSREAAETALRKLERECLMLPNGRPLVGSRGTPRVPGKLQTFPGHLSIDKVKLRMLPREMQKAVSTSHCSQPNTIEYEMAMGWKLMQTRSEMWWKELYKQQGVELEELKMQLKTK
ncbi:protein ANTI-SILENCING 1-like isoform X2 [Magnolia sinica]|uniref:protein ANTI-SILENCING 1-like isoform X2 n=1 Tax=Magnolia sinica TaxID=86752 RepID=UPI002658881C|nr:protein ANTI-SILENCING 1-like isoform X2 [Magnolia sinica]